MIPLAGGAALGLVWGWLLAQRLAARPGWPAAVCTAALAAAVLAAEAALLAGRAAALGLLVASCLGSLLRAAFTRSLAQKETPA